MKTLTLKDGRKVRIDDRDFAKASKHSWRALKKEGSTRETIVATISTAKGPRQLTLGRLIMAPPKGKFVYPRRGDLDYRRDNLVVCTMAERQLMLPKRKNENSSSRFKGVCWDNTRKLWRADIYVDGVGINLGYFPHEEAAALAYNLSAKKNFGNKCYQNQISRAALRRFSDNKTK